jgi:hypothetical protein
MSTQTIIPELPKHMRDAMRRAVNKGLMVAFINRDLPGRAKLDVRSSIVLYDDAGVFEAAIDPATWESFIAHDVAVQALHDQSGIHYWSKGV